MNSKYHNGHIVAVVIPCYKVAKHIMNVLSSIGNEVAQIYVVDDCCPEQTGLYVKENCNDSRVKVIFLQENQGVGGAVLSGYSAAMEAGSTIIVKIDGDDQMDCKLITDFINPIINGEADYTKGNRFFNLEKISNMPTIRIVGNAFLSFLTKLSSGYWDIFDPTNGYTAINTNVLRLLPLTKISRRYFFETDILFRLNTLRAVVLDIPIDARYGDEISNLKISKIVKEFLLKNLTNFIKRIFYNYYLRGMSIASIELPIGIFLISFGSIFGGYKWMISSQTGTVTPAGSVMIVGMCLIIGLQLILAFLSYDISSVPKRIISGFGQKS